MDCCAPMRDRGSMNQLMDSTSLLDCGGRCDDRRAGLHLAVKWLGWLPSFTPFVRFHIHPAARLLANCVTASQPRAPKGNDSSRNSTVWSPCRLSNSNRLFNGLSTKSPQTGRGLIGCSSRTIFQTGTAKANACRGRDNSFRTRKGTPHVDPDTCYSEPQPRQSQSR